MKRIILSLIAMVGVGLLTVVPVRAHHAFAAEFDANRPVKVQGTIAKVEWTNPHTWFHVDVKNADGQVERWMFEGGGPGSLVRRGFKKDSIAVGTELTVQGYMAKGVARRANARVMTYLDGRTLFVGSSGTGAPSDGVDPGEKK
jgi:hypothetical protein